MLTGLCRHCRLAAVKKAADATTCACSLQHELDHILGSCRKRKDGPFDPSKRILVSKQESQEPNKVLVVTTGSQVCPQHACLPHDCTATHLYLVVTSRHAWCRVAKFRSYNCIFGLQRMWTPYILWHIAWDSVQQQCRVPAVSNSSSMRQSQQGCCGCCHLRHVLDLGYNMHKLVISNTVSTPVLAKKDMHRITAYCSCHISGPRLLTLTSQSTLSD